MNITNPRTLRVFVAGWVIQDGSFPLASVGDIADVRLELYPSAASSICDETRSAIARPAYGKAPTVHRDGRLLWLHLVFGDGWSSQWWTEEPTTGPVVLSGVFSARLDDWGIDEIPRVRGRIKRIDVVRKQVRAVDNGWYTIEGTDQLAAIDAVSAEIHWWPTDVQEGDLIASGVLVELDLDDVPVLPTTFVAGALAVDDEAIWVMHSSDPVLLRVQCADGPTTITRFLLPMTIEPPTDRWARRIHVTDDGCWITSEHDIHRCELMPDGELTVDRYAVDGGWTSAVDEGQLYLLGSAWSHMTDDRRHGVIRTYPDAQRLRMLDESGRRIVPVDGPAHVSGRRADRAFSADGTQWCVDGTNVLRRIDPDGSTSTIDLSHVSATGPVRSTTPDPFSDPANADVMARITVDAARLRIEADLAEADLPDEI